MDITEAFAPGGGNEDLGKDYFEYVVSPAPHGTTGGDPVSDEEGFTGGFRRSIGVSFIQDSRQDSHDSRHDLHSSFVKETNNNTLTALPPVSTITGSLTHHHHHHHHHNHNHNRNHICPVQNSDVTMDQPDCDYWGDEGKEQPCNILLEDLSKYCWSTPTTNSPSQTHGDGIVQGDVTARGCGANLHRQNTDGAIYTLTVLNNDANSMDGLDCCKSPPPPSGDSWTMRPNLDLEAILSLDPSGDDSVAESSRSERFHVIPVGGMGSQYSTDDSGFVESNKDMCARNSGQTPGSGDNNNDWKLSDQNHLTDSQTPGSDSAESLLRSALQGKLYSGTNAQVVSSSSSNTSQTSSLTLQNTAVNSPHVQIIATDHQTDEAMHPCTEEDLLLSQLDTANYRPEDYEKLKSIANEVVDYCRLEPTVCNVSATTTVMYTLDPASGSLGTITLPADLSQVSTVTVVTAGQQDAVMSQTVARPEPETASTQIPISPPRTVATTNTKPAKKYVRRGNRNGSNSSGGSGGTANTNGGQQQGSGSPGSVQRKERSLHYCSICSKGFKDKYSVNVHIRTHTGEKPFACSLCGKSFRQKAHLAKHYQTHVAQKPTSVTAVPTAQTNTVQPAASNSNTPAENAAAPAAHNQTHTGADQNATCNTTTS